MASRDTAAFFDGKFLKTNGELIWNISDHDVYRYELGTRAIVNPVVESFKIGNEWKKIYLADTHSL